MIVEDPKGDYVEQSGFDTARSGVETGRSGADAGIPTEPNSEEVKTTTKIDNKAEDKVEVI